ncbi:MAG TPA: ABC transporter permease, partial [Candidatus Dormibacteraeota bacterium]|nr:ABC transporter permease [Candidatus Dormibacteraeota bacterium]
MSALLGLTVANLKSFVRDRVALFWTIAFPIIFVFLFGTLFGGGNTEFRVGWVDLDRTAASAQLQAAFSGAAVLKLTPSSHGDALVSAQRGDL